MQKRWSGLASRIYLAFLIAAAVPVAIAGLVGIFLSIQALRTETLKHLEQDLGSRSAAIGRFIDQLSSEVRYLSGSSPVRELADLSASGRRAPERIVRRRIERDFANFAKAYPYIYQARYLDAAGREMLRIDRRGDSLTAVPAHELQDKSDRYYFREALLLEPGAIYVSPLDLNVERGQVEVPERPVIRFGTPVTDSAGIKRGLLIINLHADLFLAEVEQMAGAHGATAYLFDRAGFYLARHAPDSALREPFAMHAVATLAPRLGDSVLARILAGDRGTAEVTEHIVAYAPIAPTAMADSTDTARPGWALAIEYPQNRFLAAVFNLYVLYGVLGACLLVTAMAGYLLSRRLLRPLELLQSETAQIAKGNFARRVEIKGADEIADLGRSMNAMAEQLERSYGALQDRKAFLESEVAARTAALDSERRHLAAIIDNTADAIVAFDAAGTVQLANHAAQAMLREGMVGADIAGVWPGWSDIAPMMAPKCAPESGADAPPVRRLDCAVGARRLSVVVSTLAGERGRSHILVARDVTDERRLVLERRELDRQIFLREKIATMGELAMGLAHEIGNPLAGMKAVVQALLDDETLAPRVRTYLGRFEKEVDRLAAFLRTFHGFAAPQDAQPAACHLESVLDDVLLWTRKDAQSKHIAITYQRCGAIPPLWADPNQLRQVLLNLVINAVHAVERDGHVNIRMCAPVALLHPHQGIARAKFCVEDDGPGIAADVLPRIFDPFFTTKRDGSGLGLAVVKKIAAQHGADVHVHSGPGRGTRFELVWPIAAAAAETFEAVEPLRRCAHPSDVVEVTVEETYG